MGIYDDWFDKKNDFEKEKIERDRDWDKLNEYEKSKIYEEEEGN